MEMDFFNSNIYFYRKILKNLSSSNHEISEIKKRMEQEFFGVNEKF